MTSKCFSNGTQVSIIYHYLLKLPQNIFVRLKTRKVAVNQNLSRRKTWWLNWNRQLLTRCSGDRTAAFCVRTGKRCGISPRFVSRCQKLLYSTRLFINHAAAGAWRVMFRSCLCCLAEYGWPWHGQADWRHQNDGRVVLEDRRQNDSWHRTQVHHVAARLACKRPYCCLSCMLEDTFAEPGSSLRLV